jgi:hypothetical protein
MCRNHLNAGVRLTAVILICLLATQRATGQSVLYVDDDAPPAGNGLTWYTACRFLQDALAIASDPGNGVTEIHVAQGTYAPDRDESNPQGAGECFMAGGVGCPDPVCEAAVCAVLPTCCFVAWDEVCVTIALDECVDARAATFQLPNGVALMGGYAGLGDPENPDHRDIVGQETALSGDLAGNDDPDPIGSGFLGYDENSWHVVTGGGTDATAGLDGFTITAGHANGPGYPPDLDGAGAGMLNVAGSPTVSRCLFTTNRALDPGAGMLNIESASPAVTECTFEYNEVDVADPSPGGGGGMANAFDSNATVSACVFRGNFGEAGGGLVNNASSPIVTDCIFESNQCTDPATPAEGCTTR